MFLVYLFPSKVIRLADGKIECLGVNQIEFLIDNVCLPDLIGESPDVLLRSWAKFFISLAAATVIALHYAHPRTLSTHSPTADT